MSDFRVVPILKESYEGRQIGYLVERDGDAFLHVSTGGTGDCWNVELLQNLEDEDVHICDLAEFIDALIALRDSEAHRVHVERWKIPAHPQEEQGDS